MLDSITKGSPMRKPADKHSRSDRDKTKHKASSGSRSSHRDAGAKGPPLSFLFVANELVVNSALASANRDNCTDDWFNRVPPRDPSGYVAEIVSRVMRYADGEVTAANGYHWFREEFPQGEPWKEGRVCAYDANGMPLYEPSGLPCYLAKYKTFAVFSCNPLLPIVVVDGDPTTDRTLKPYPLLLFHPRDMPGVTQAVTEDSTMGIGGGVAKFVAGSHPSWVPSLVPLTYSNPYPNAPPSRGLAGELPIVIGLMAFSEAGDPAGGTNRTEEIFLGGNGHRGRWRGGKWHHNGEPPAGYVASMQEDPRGFLVVVFLDPENPEGSTEELLQQLEWYDTIVQDSSSHRRP